jgi:hypothetical protein
VKPVIVAESTVIVQVALDTTSPGAARASLGVVGDGEARPARDAALATGVSADGVGTTGVPVTGEVGTGSDTRTDGTGAARDEVAGELGLGLGDVGKQKMIRMQAWPGAG